jgi:hypothetical protein
MRSTVRLSLLVLSLALAGTGCTAATPPATPYESQGSAGPQAGSTFWARIGAVPDGLPAGIIASINKTPGGPRRPTDWSMTGSDYSDTGGAWLAAEIPMSCEDPGDGTALRQAWVSAIDNELGRLGALVISNGSGQTYYRLDGFRGQI